MANGFPKLAKEKGLKPGWSLRSFYLGESHEIILPQVYNLAPQKIIFQKS